MVSTFFLGACTAEGFTSHYDSLLTEGIPLTIIKGGSGCGKSTFMRKIGQAAEQCGMDVTYILCSSDPDSLDGVVIPEIPIAFVDGTAPHVLEPKLCGGSMNYLNFGTFYDSAAMQSNEQSIFEVQAANAAQYRYVTACLGAIQQLETAIHTAIKDPYFTQEVDAIAECITLSSLRVHDGWPRETFRYLSAITPQGIKVCSDTPSALCKRVYVLHDDYGLAPQLLQKIRDKAAEMSHECIVCHSPLQFRGAPAHLLLPTADTAIVCESADFPYTGDHFCRIDLNSTLPPLLRESLSFYLCERSSLLQQVIKHMTEAKRLHDRIELLCRPFVDFDAVNALTEHTAAMLFGS